jgi:hypothetical protein
MVRRKVAGIPVITIVAGITLAYLIWMIVASFAFPAVGGRIGASTIGTLVGFFATGFIVFYVARWYRMKNEGIDIGWTFQSVPPV